MALAFKDLDVVIALPGDVTLRLLEITGDTSYPTGGTAITPAQVQLSRVDAIIVIPEQVPEANIYSYIASTGKLAATVGSTGAEVANATNLSGKKFLALAIGAPE